MHVDSLADARWYDQFRVATVAALERRLRRYDVNIAGLQHVSVQIGYEQLLRRVQSLLQLHRLVRIWLDSQDDGELPKILEVWPPLRAYLAYVDKHVGGDMQLLLIRATFYYHE